VLALSHRPLLPSALSSTSASGLGLSRLNGWPMRSPVNASPTPSRVLTHDSGASVVRYTFTARDFHSLLFAGFAGALITSFSLASGQREITIDPAASCARATATSIKYLANLPHDNVPIIACWLPPAATSTRRTKSSIGSNASVISYYFNKPDVQSYNLAHQP
jgi:hypothetical protein